jgi:hypothetical protein
MISPGNAIELEDFEGLGLNHDWRVESQGLDCSITPKKSIGLCAEN